VKRLVVFATVVVAAIVAGLLLLLTGDQPYDRSFDTSVNEPAYRGQGPVVLYDEGHLNSHSTTEGYKPFADLLRSDGYVVRVFTDPLAASALEGVTILVLVLPRGANDANDEPAYSAAELDVVDTWVRGGGSLLLVSDHWPYGSAAAPLARRFDVEMGLGLVEDETQHDTERGTSHLIFSTENGLLHDHAIVRGRNDGERVRRVLTFTGESLSVPAAAVPFLALSDTATERPPGAPKVARDGSDVRVDMLYGDPLPAAGRAQGLALEVGAGRVVVLGEAGMLRAQRGSKGMNVGMNVPGYDNRQLALNIAHWLSRAV
jgi:hypothetical protein